MLLTAAALAVLAVSAAAETARNDAEPSRYPFDPVCAWGRLGNGKGLFVRCLTQHEAISLSASAPAGANAAPTASGVAPAPSVAPSAPGATARLDVSVGPVVADEGKLAGADKKLAVPKDRYVECVTANGGLKGGQGEVAVRFLVRGRGRAEGVGVSKRSGMSEAAARCIAEVVDRRYVGPPEVEMVGATVVIKLREVTP
jgi:hypothetical protein